MSSPIKIRLDSNIMREPQRLRDMGNLAAGIGLDVLLWGAWNNSTLGLLHVPDFCEMFGYQRKHLLRPVDDKKKVRLGKVLKTPEHLENLGNSLGWTLLAMSKYNLVFYTNAQGRIPLNLSKKTKDCRYQSLTLLESLDPDTCIKKHKTGTLATVEFSERFIYNCREFYQEVDLTDYLSLKTAAGHADDQARRMYLHMTWRRQLWDGMPVPKGYDPSKPEYDELLSVAGLAFTDPKQNAARLRALLKRVCVLPTVKLTATITHKPAIDRYEVLLAKDGGRIRPKRQKREKQPKLAL